MFCNQCEQTAHGTGCTTVGVCGKRPEIAALQEFILSEVVAISLWMEAARPLGLGNDAIDAAVEKALFHTITNVDFDADSLAAVVRSLHSERGHLAAAVPAAGGGPRLEDASLAFVPADALEELEDQAIAVGHFSDRAADADIRSLQELTVYGIKGIAAYADHARILGQSDPEVAAFVYKAFAALADRSLGAGEWVALALEAGAVNLRVMELLDTANTGAYGDPVPTSVPLGHRPAHAILVSGHDLADLDSLLEATAGTGIDVYTHGEMLPAHGYPKLHAHSQLYGHYGTAWQNQRREFVEFPGAILMTTNCIQAPKAEYAGNIFTTGNVNWPGAVHVNNGDWSPVIARALELPGFAEESDGGSVLVGFGHETVLGIAPQVVEAVKSGAIRHFFLVGGCDGAKPGRSYYTDFVDATPADTVVLTLACGKFRFFDHDLGEIGGIPRLLDVGQCNDSYSAIRIALALSEAFGVGVNQLPLSFVISWYEQKAVAVLLTLLHLGISGIRLGPTMPAFVSPNVLKVLVERFAIKPIGGDAKADLEELLTVA
jgi:hydroxylamine reductase